MKINQTDQQVIGNKKKGYKFDLINDLENQTENDKFSISLFFIYVILIGQETQFFFKKTLYSFYYYK